MTMSMKISTVPLAPPLTPNGYDGYLVRNVRTTGFKLAIIVGRGHKNNDHLRVRYWRAASHRWTQPTTIDRRYLTPLTDDEREARAGLIRAATLAAAEFTRKVWS